MTSSNGNIFRVTGPLWEESTGVFPSQRPVTRSCDVFFDLRVNKRLSKQTRRWWLEAPPRSLWHHCNVWSQLYIYIYIYMNDITLCHSYTGVLEANSSDDAKKVRRDCLESNASASSQSQGAAVRHDAGEVHEKADFIWAKCVVPSEWNFRLPK